MTPASPLSDPPDGRRTEGRSRPLVVVNRAVVDLMAQPSLAAERVSQAMVGDACEILAQRADWVEVRLERDGYTGWTQRAALHEVEPGTLHATELSRVLVVAEIASAFAHSEREQNIGKLPFGVELPFVEERNGRVAVRLPDQRVWWLARHDTLAAARRPAADAPGIALALSLVRRSVGVPYLWGGCTPFGYDCSGLTQAFWAFLGVRIPRDADQQFQRGEEQATPPAPGDLLFFRAAPSSGERARHADVRHVAIFLGGKEILHASAATRSVTVDQLGPGAGTYGDWLHERLAGVRRFTACG